jgi:hypothetical protein
MVLTSQKGENPMNRIVGIVAGVLFLGSACAGSSSEGAAEIERSEEMEQTAGDERALVGTNPGEMEGWMPPNAEEDVVMETEPYPE